MSLGDQDGGSWSPTGNKILFVARPTPDSRRAIWVVNADGSGLRELPIPDCGGLFADPTSIGCDSRCGHPMAPGSRSCESAPRPTKRTSTPSNPTAATSSRSQVPAYKTSAQTGGAPARTLGSTLDPVVLPTRVFRWRFANTCRTRFSSQRTVASEHGQSPKIHGDRDILGDPLSATA